MTKQNISKESELKNNDITLIKSKIIDLANRKLSAEITNISQLPVSGSSRIYFRIYNHNGSYIATYNSNIDENNAFLYFTKHFRDAGLAVPEIIAESEDKKIYIQSDLGDTSLFDMVQKCVKENHFNDETIRLYKESISHLVDFQIKGNINIDYSLSFPSSSFDKDSIIDDLNYFKYYFLKVNDEIVFNETLLNHDFHAIADYAAKAPSDFFMYRDFQSRNIMIKDCNTFFIDYQGGRKGPLQYDIVSLLYQVKAQIPAKLRNELLSHYKESLGRYLNVEQLHFDKYYKTFVLLRLLQVLGAYGFRGLIQKKQHFIESIPFALKEIINLKDELDFPFEIKELTSVLGQMNQLISKYQIVKNDKLTVEVNSFSYKKGGIPEDRGGNGGGFVFDCRALPNPGRYDEYKSLTGQDAEVQEFLNNDEEVQGFARLTQSIIFSSVDNYLKRNFKNLSVSFGCTGGQHRSVFFAEKMAESLHERYPHIRIILKHLAQNKYYMYETTTNQ